MNFEEGQNSAHNTNQCMSVFDCTHCNFSDFLNFANLAVEICYHLVEDINCYLLSVLAFNIVQISGIIKTLMFVLITHS